LPAGTLIPTSLPISDPPASVRIDHVVVVGKTEEPVVSSSSVAMKMTVPLGLDHDLGGCGSGKVEKAGRIDGVQTIGQHRAYIRSLVPDMRLIGADGEKHAVPCISSLVMHHSPMIKAAMEKNRFANATTHDVRVSGLTGPELEHLVQWWYEDVQNPADTMLIENWITNSVNDVHKHAPRFGSLDPALQVLKISDITMLRAWQCAHELMDDRLLTALMTRATFRVNLMVKIIDSESGAGIRVKKEQVTHLSKECSLWLHVWAVVTAPGIPDAMTKAWQPLCETAVLIGLTNRVDLYDSYLTLRSGEQSVFFQSQVAPLLDRVASREFLLRVALSGCTRTT